MSNSKQVDLGGTTVTFGDCDDPQHTGMKFVSIGTKQNHTTFIVSPNYANPGEIRARGADLDAWSMVAHKVTTGYWD